MITEKAPNGQRQRQEVALSLKDVLSSQSTREFTEWIVRDDAPWALTTCFLDFAFEKYEMIAEDVELRIEEETSWKGTLIAIDNLLYTAENMVHFDPDDLRGLGDVSGYTRASRSWRLAQSTLRTIQGKIVDLISFRKPNWPPEAPQELRDRIVKSDKTMGNVLMAQRKKYEYGKMVEEEERWQARLTELHSLSEKMPAGQAAAKSIKEGVSPFRFELKAVAEFLEELRKPGKTGRPREGPTRQNRAVDPSVLTDAGFFHEPAAPEPGSSKQGQRASSSSDGQHSIPSPPEVLANEGSLASQRNRARSAASPLEALGASAMKKKKSCPPSLRQETPMNGLAPPIPEPVAAPVLEAGPASSTKLARTQSLRSTPRRRSSIRTSTADDVPHVFAKTEDLDLPPISVFSSMANVPDSEGQPSPLHPSVAASGRSSSLSSVSSSSTSRVAEELTSPNVAASRMAATSSSSTVKFYADSTAVASSPSLRKGKGKGRGRKRKAFEMEESEEVKVKVARTAFIKATNAAGTGLAQCPINLSDDEEALPQDFVNGEGDEYEVEKIIARKSNGCRPGYQCLVRWLGYGPEMDTWEPESELRGNTEWHRFMRDHYLKGGAPKSPGQGSKSIPPTVATKKPGRPRKPQ